MIPAAMDIHVEAQMPIKYHRAYVRRAHEFAISAVQNESTGLRDMLSKENYLVVWNTITCEPWTRAKAIHVKMLAKPINLRVYPGRPKPMYYIAKTEYMPRYCVCN